MFSFSTANTRKVLLSALVMPCVAMSFSRPVAAQPYPESPAGTACAAPIMRYVTGQTQKVERLRISSAAPDPKGVRVEIGSPNLPGTGAAKWAFTIRTPDIVSQAEKTIAITKGGWVAFVYSGIKGVPLVSYKVFTLADGGCHEADNFGDLGDIDTLPVGVLDIMKPRIDADRSIVTAVPSVGPRPETKPPMPIAVSQPMATLDDQGLKACARYHSDLPLKKISRLSTSDYQGGLVFEAEGGDGRQPNLARASDEQVRRWKTLADAGKGWAIFSRSVVDGEDRINVQYIFLSDGGCEAWPAIREKVSTIWVPNQVARHFLTAAGLSTGDNEKQYREKLQQSLTTANQSMIDADLNRPKAPTTFGQVEAALAAAAAEAAADPHADDIHDAETSLALLATYPKPLVRELKGYSDECRMHGGDLRFGPEFVRRLDVDRDGRDDYVANGDHLFCLDSENRPQLIGGGNKVTSLRVIMNTPAGPMMALDEMVPSGKLYSYAGSAVWDGGSGTWRLSRGKAEEIKSVPRNGRVIFELSR